MNPNVVDAIGRLRQEGVLSEAQAAPLLRAARREIVSVELELRVLLYAGVLLVTTAVGLFLEQNHDRIGPSAIATLLGVAAAACFVFAWRRLPAFSWQSTVGPHLAADYVLLLGVLLVAADLAYVETQFRVLGPHWPNHLLVVAMLALGAAYRFDSRTVLSLGLTSLAAWRGVAVSLAFASSPVGQTPAVRANALACGALFIAAGIVSLRFRRKAHFEPVYVTLGLLLIFGALLSGVFGGTWRFWLAPLEITAALVVALAYRHRRVLVFAIAVIAAYLGGLRLLAEVFRAETSFLLVVAVTSLAVVALLVIAQRRMRDAR
jgi:hypothetical protein